MKKIKLTPAEIMLVSITNTEREQAIQQIDAIYRQRIESLLKTYNTSWAENPQITQDGQELFLVIPGAVPLPNSDGSPS